MTVKITGLHEIQRKLESLPDRMQQNVLASGNGAVARALAKDMKQGLSGSIHPFRDAVKASQNPMRRKTKGFIVGLRKPFSSLAHLFEFGTAERVQKTTGRRTGRMPAEPFMRPALEQMGGDKAEQIWTKAAARAFERQLAKLK